MLCTSSVVDDITFSHYSKLTRIKDDAYDPSSSPGGSTVDENCHLPLLLVTGKTSTEKTIKVTHF